MLCPFCNKELPDDTEFCQYCGKQINKSEKNNNALSLFISIIKVILVLSIIVFIKIGYKTFISPKVKAMVRPPVNKTEVKNAVFVRTFYLSNTESLKAFCKDTGYIPNNFINLFSSSFANSIQNADDIIAKYGFNKNELDRSSSINEKIFAEYEKDFNYTKSVLQDKMDISYTKEDYCKSYDADAAKMVEIKINKFKNAKPDLYLD